MSACQAIEAACGAEVTGPLRDLRLLLYYDEWIESHALHVYLLHAPDFLGYDSGVAMAAGRRDLVERGLQLKKAGNELVAAIGGRPIHPVNVRVGGFYRVPSRRELAPSPNGCAAPATTPSPPSSGSPGSTAPTWSTATGSSRCATPASTPSCPARSPPATDTARSPGSRWRGGPTT
ncbi:hypothetical protein GCM10010116_33680 [Microbispora rosea subsp. aerata]|nr:hypothetical protein GCM10010116_33680 [Microbispora rosea subsp. aerata]GIH56020.1 hypothetical protein Mro02_29340 [Microbispora rosea subsp. aerata]GLJ86619.1 hypothetical protein GCM10017588_53570 [Microbispora rosea subsp. aerata]